MQDRKERAKDLLDQILGIEKELDKLYASSFEIGELYAGNIFPEQEKLATSLENLFIAATHESASEIGFMRNRCTNLIHYIEFRERYKNFTDIELNEIIDNPVSLALKMELSHKFENAKAALDAIHKLKSEWNATFNNMGYLYFKNKNKIL